MAVILSLMQSLWPIFSTSMCQCSNKQEIGSTAKVCPCTLMRANLHAHSAFAKCHIYVSHVMSCYRIYQIAFYFMSLLYEAVQIVNSE